MQKTTRRTLIAGGAVLGAAAALSAQTGAEPAGPEAVEPTIVMPALLHTVYFWLKNPDSDADRAKLIEGIRTLAAIETVRAIHVGTPASTEKREVVDNSWQVSEMLAFDDVAGQNVYQEHPLHKKFVEQYSHLWQKVVVFDAMTAG